MIKKIKREKIILKKELSSLFSINSDVLKTIRADMKKNGFKDSHPVILWKDEKEKYILVDGHTRLKSASDCQIDLIPAKIMSFKNIEEAIDYSNREQNSRRNLSSSELYCRFVYYKELGIKGKGREADKIGERLGISSGQVRKLLYIYNNASKAEIKKLKESEVTVNSVYNKTRNILVKEEPPKDVKEETMPIGDDLKKENISQEEKKPSQKKKPVLAKKKGTFAFEDIEKAFKALGEKEKKKFVQTILSFKKNRKKRFEVSLFWENRKPFTVVILSEDSLSIKKEFAHVAGLDKVEIKELLPEND